MTARCATPTVGGIVTTDEELAVQREIWLRASSGDVDRARAAVRRAIRQWIRISERGTMDFDRKKSAHHIANLTALLLVL
jgi:hypothetical protein